MDFTEKRANKLKIGDIFQDLNDSTTLHRVIEANMSDNEVELTTILLSGQLKGSMSLSIMSAAVPVKVKVSIVKQYWFKLKEAIKGENQARQCIQS